MTKHRRVCDLCGKRRVTVDVGPPTLPIYLCQECLEKDLECHREEWKAAKFDLDEATRDMQNIAANGQKLRDALDLFTRKRNQCK